MGIIIIYNFTGIKRLKKMKHLLKILFLLPLFLSCTNAQEDFIPIPEEVQTAIGFNAKALDSRAAVSSVSDIDTFKVYAVMSEEPDEKYEQGSDVDYNHILEGEKVYWNASLNTGQGGYTYDNPQYWVNDRAFHFFGCYPYDTTTELDDDGISYNLEYSATIESAQNKDDLLTFHYSTHTEANQTVYPAVPVTFNRALTQISSEITQDFESNPYDKFCVTSVTFSGISAGGTLTTSRFDKTGQWHLTDDKLSFSKEYTAPGEQLAANPLTVFDGLNLVPQKIDNNNNKIAFIVNYTYQQGDSDELTGEVENKTATIYLPISEWLPGKKYNYKLVLYKNNLIVFSNIVVSTWGEQPDAGTIIIK